MDQVKIQPFTLPTFQEPASQTETAGAAEGAFMSSLKDAIAKVNDAQLQANQAVDSLMTGETENVHGAMVALQKADVSFQLMMQVRNKLVSAYEEIQRMQI
jgi:flagellar hook-basal body complex protein FliE